MSRALAYSAFGLRLCTDHLVPGLIPAEASEEADTRVWFYEGFPVQAIEGQEETWYCSSFIESGRPAVCVSKLAGGAYVRWRYSDGTEFVINQTGSDVWAHWPESSTLEDTVTYLLGPILGFVLRLRGVTCLHASAVAVDDRVIAFVGPACAGKSTTAAAFGRLGYPILSDDIAVLADVDERPHVQPAYPQLRLWPESVAFLYGSADALPPLTANWDKRFLDLTDVDRRFETKLLPLAAIYLLGDRAELPAVEPITSRDALLALVANTYVNYLEDAETRGREFKSLGRVVSTVPVRKAAPPADPERLPQFCRRIIDDVQHR